MTDPIVGWDPEDMTSCNCRNKERLMRTVPRQRKRRESTSSKSTPHSKNYSSKIINSTRLYLRPRMASFLFVSSSILRFSDGVSLVGRSGLHQQVTSSHAIAPRTASSSPTLLSRRNNFPTNAFQTSWALHMSNDSSDDANSRKDKRDKSTEMNPSGGNKHRNNKNQSRNKRKRSSNEKKTTQATLKPSPAKGKKENSLKAKKENQDMRHRITQLEALVAQQAIEIRRLKLDSQKLIEATEVFAQVVDIMRQKGLSVGPEKIDDDRQSYSMHSDNIDGGISQDGIKEFQYFDDEIFGTAPSSITDAADSAGASILAAILGGKHRMLVDVRDAELSRDPEILVQFIELAILPVAAGLEGLNMDKNRVKIVFPTVFQLMQFRRTMALAAPEVVALSTLGFDPVEDRDNLVLIVAPSPDDEEGLSQMNDLLLSPSLCQPVVVLNHHMCPLAGPAGEFDPVYHLRLLSVQYMTGEGAGEDWGPINKKDEGKSFRGGSSFTSLRESPSNELDDELRQDSESNPDLAGKEDDALEAAMEHAHEGWQGVHQGVTRAMVIRAYPRPWHVFVDTSPDTDADFEVAATFDEFPSQEDVNYAIVECLEGSEIEDELVAQQMQEALEAGQLNAVTQMLGLAGTSNIEIDMKAGEISSDDHDDTPNNEVDEDEDDWDHWETDTV